MKRRVAVALALLVLAVAAPLAMANSHSELVVGSIHTTGADFNGATTLDNVIVSGTGSSSSVGLSGVELVDDFEDNDETVASPIWTGWDLNAGEDSNTQFSVSSNGYFEGSHEGHLSITSRGSEGIFAERSNPGTGALSTKVRFEQNSGHSEDGHRIGFRDGGDSGTVIGSIKFYRSNGIVAWGENSPSDGSSDDTQVRSSWSADTNYDIRVVPDFDANEVEIFIDGTSEGTYSFVNSASEWDTIGYTSDTNDGNNNGDLYFDVVEYADTTPSGEGVYTSGAHSVEDASQAFVNLTLEDAHADYRIEFGGSGSWTTAASGTLSTTGNHTIDVSSAPDSATQWRTNVTLVNETTAATTAQIHDEGIQFTGHAPTTSNLSPSDGETLSAAGPTLSAEVTDSDVALAQGDEITAEFYLDGSQVGSDTLTSNGTATHSTSGLTGGAHDWHVELTDDYGLETTTDTRTFHTPSELRIYNESSPRTLVTDPVDVTVQFFADNGTVYERSTDDGVVDFSSLPVDREFTVTANPEGPDTGPNYQSRSTHIESLVEQQEIYLLNENVQSANVVYTLVDNSGQFTPPEETTLFIEKALTINGQTAYRTVTSDQFSATNEMVATLEDDQRYRLRLEGPDVDTRVLGSYRTAGDDAAQLTVGQVSFEGATASAPSFHANVQDIQGTRALRITYTDPANATDALTLEAVNRTNSSDVIRPETTEAGPFGQYSEVIPLSSSADDVSFNVSYEADRSGFADQSGVVFVGDLPPIAQNLHMDPDVLSALGLMTIFGTLGLTAIARPRFAGIPTVVVAVGLVGLGVLVIHPLLLAGAGVIALLFAVGGGR